MIFPFSRWFLSIFYFKLFVAEYRPNLDTSAAHTETSTQSQLWPQSVKQHKNWKMKVVVYFFSKSPRRKGAQFSLAMLLLKGARSLLQGACLALAEPEWGGTALGGSWCPAQLTPKGRFKDRVGRKGPFGWLDPFSSLWPESRLSERLN